MQGICGFLHLDGQRAAASCLEGMRAALVRTSWSTGTSSLEGHLGLAGMHWAAHEQPWVLPLVVRHGPSGCSIAAEARLDDRDELRKAIGLPADDPACAHDAALILHAWLRWKTRCVDHIEGDFAFAVHDPGQGGIFLARDRFGVRPLVYHHSPGRLIAFGSSTSSVLAHPDVPRTVNEGRIADSLVTELEGIDKTSTFHQGIQRLPPASTLWIDAAGSRLEHYWSLRGQLDRVAQNVRSSDEWAEAFSAALELAVGRHLAAPEPLGCMLSGGMDSSSLAVIARDQLRAMGRGPLPTFSAIDSTSPADAETAAVRAMLALGGFQPSFSDLATLGADTTTLLSCLEDSEEPFDASMTLIHAQYLTASRAGIAALMDGIDGDSLLLSGEALARQVRSGHWREALRNARSNSRTYPDGPTMTWQLLRATARAFLPAAIRRTLKRLSGRDTAQSRMAGSLISQDFADRIGVPERLKALDAHGANRPDNPLGEAIATFEHPYLTVGLERYHRIAASHGISPRHPFIDRRLVELAVHLPDRQRHADGWAKAILRRIMTGRLPPEVRLRRDKQHLGWKFIRAVLAPDLGQIRQQLNDQWELLAPYLDRHQLEAALDRGGDAALEAVLTAQALAAWLRRGERR